MRRPIFDLIAFEERVSVLIMGLSYLNSNNR